MPTDYNFKPKDPDTGLGWYSRGYLPHFDAGETAQFFTFRLFDSLPAAVIEQLRQKYDVDSPVYRRRLERYMDLGHGECYLRDPRVAAIVRDALLFHAGKQYTLYSWVIMPNHMHYVARPNEGVEIRTIAHSLKSFTAHSANKLLKRSGQFWQHEPFDRYIRNLRHFRYAVNYIERNPVKAGLCQRPQDWQFSSAWQPENNPIE